MGHTGAAVTEQNVTNPARDRAKYADPSGEMMKALCWMGKNDVQVCKYQASIVVSYHPGLTAFCYSGHAETRSGRGPRCDPESHGQHSLRKRFTSSTRSVVPLILSRALPKYLGSAGAVIQMQKGDILGHEFCGKIDSMGAAVKGLKKGDRVVASFQIACGECMYCKKKLSSQCERTNSNKTENMMYGGNTAGI